MRVFNLTDVSTPALEQYGLVGQHIAVSGRMVNPGEYADVEDTPTSRDNLSHLLRVGAVAIDKLPPPYVQAVQQAAASSGRLAARVGQHVELKETKVAGESPPGPPAEGETMVLSRDDPAAQASDAPAPPKAEDPPPLQPPAPQPKSKKSGK